MKKRLLLLAIPALMALSSCTYLASGAAQPKGNFFKEEASAAEEVFGKVEAVNFKNPNRSISSDLAEPVIGVQYRAKYQNDGDPNWYVAVRFVAAVKTLNVNASWTRSVYEPDGDILGSETSIPTTQAYTSLNSDDEPITPAVFAGDANYHYFVAYTLKDIPFSENDDYFISAFVTLLDNEGSLPSVSSLRMAARIGGNVTVKFPNNTPGYFLAGTLGGVANQVLASESAPTGNVARFESALEENDFFFVCNNDTANSKFRVYDSSCLAYANNPFLRDDGSSAKKIKVMADHNYAFNFSNSEQITDIDGGYTLTYENNSDVEVTLPLIFYNVEDYKNQFRARISPKPGSSLAFKLGGSEIVPDANSGANVNGSLEILFGGPEIDVYLKEQNSNYTLWVTYPSEEKESYSLYIDDVLSPVSNTVPDGWEDKALFVTEISEGSTVKVKWGYTFVSAASPVSRTAQYRVFFHADHTVSYDYLYEYCLVGKINGVEDWSGNSHPFADPDGDGQYTLVNTIELKNGDRIKVRGGNGAGTWFPGDGGDYNITSDGTYQIYFKPDYSGGGDWHYNCFYVQKQ